MIVLFAMAMATASASDRLSCTVTPRRIDIAIPASLDPSIRSIAVVRAGTWRTIVDDEHRLAPYRPGDRRLSLPRRTQKAVAWRHGRARTEKAFPAAGTYRIVFADNLETEPDNMTALSCRVRLR